MQVSSNSKAAAVALPVVVLASSRGLALGCRDALARFRADPSSAADYQHGLGFAPARQGVHCALHLMHYGAAA